jgi:hypothetical protein
VVRLKWNTRRRILARLKNGKYFLRPKARKMQTLFGFERPCTEQIEFPPRPLLTQHLSREGFEGLGGFCFYENNTDSARMTPKCGAQKESRHQ